jgi:hypothetical protein
MFSDYQKDIVILQHDDDLALHLRRSLVDEVGLPPSCNEHLQTELLESPMETVNEHSNENVVSHLRFPLADEISLSPFCTEQNLLEKWKRVKLQTQPEYDAVSKPWSGIPVNFLHNSKSNNCEKPQSVSIIV